MSLASTADTVGAAIASALDALPKGADHSADAWKIVMEKIADWITTNGKATIAASSIVTTGTAATQTGPAAPVQCSIA